jgi:cytochrome bd-type quinol oxidase subunit 2
MTVRPLAWLFVAAIAAGGWMLWKGLRGSAETRAFAGSCLVIVGLLGAAAASLFPEFLHSTLSPEYSLTAHGGATSGPGLSIALFWWPIAAGLAAIYFVTIARKYRGKVRVTDDTQGFY